LFELLGRGSGSGWIDAMLRRRSDFQLFGILRLRGKSEESSEENS